MVQILGNLELHSKKSWNYEILNFGVKMIISSKNKNFE